jgi:hypothetical protein
MKIVAHTIVKNEARFVWYAVSSVIEHVDRVLLWDTGSTDGTSEILKELKILYKDKIDLQFVGDVTPQKFREVRKAWAHRWRRRERA